MVELTENKRFIYCFEGIEDKWETVEEYKYTPCTKDGFQDLCVMLNELHEENKELRLLVDTLKEQNMKFKLRLEDLGVEYL